MKKPFRDISFWGRAARIYSSYKVTQIRVKILDRHKRKEAEAVANRTEGLWNSIHELNSNRMMELCLSLRGFYLKTGQFLGSRYDFMPTQFTTKLGKLHDDVPPLSAKEIRITLEQELHGRLEDFFTFLDLSKPIGSASVAQVHLGVWRETGEQVAVKIQYPTAERLMRGDLSNLRALAEFLQKTELKFDLLSSIKELQRQIGNEFDFINEAKNMDYMRNALLKTVPEVVLPRSIYASKRALIMTYLDGDNLSRMAEFRNKKRNVPLWIRHKIGKSLLDVLAKAWGVMIFELKFFNADPHPGNIIFRTGSSNKVGLLDWGQMKRIPDYMALNFAHMVEALNTNNQTRVIESFFRLGVTVDMPDDVRTTEGIARTMLDTKPFGGFDMNPFSDKNALRSNAVTSLPTELYFLVRTVQLMRGIAFAFDLDYSLAHTWAPYAKKTIKELSHISTLK
eukprot:CAMPEP_0182430998 /NCGR_PEP_ID=MMETSP1167-20130531/45511_1 /TAXON_ID=2988 /ORGANISM="Mallomonas Sp, Strain CCMP3275" /LENGTH=451 /DNA_ID=CAMNT_0024616813 /DNA_START=224 /DNA_END=1579 /DNA_ORIENTATION=-